MKMNSRNRHQSALGGRYAQQAEDVAQDFWLELAAEHLRMGGWR